MKIVIKDIEVKARSRKSYTVVITKYVEILSRSRVFILNSRTNEFCLLYNY